MSVNTLSDTVETGEGYDTTRLATQLIQACARQAVFSLLMPPLEKVNHR
ncbi:MAG TPA: hypothetical protein VK404_10485 [Spirosoma sp.]|nr:hypothetical protein [Spirosoma sp.]